MDEVLREIQIGAEAAEERRSTVTLREALEGRLLDRIMTHGMKRSSRKSDEQRSDRLCRDLGGDLPIQVFTDGRLVSYFEEEFVAERRIPSKSGEDRLAEGRDVVERTITCWTAQSPGSEPVEVSTKNEAVRIAHELGGKWKHRRPGCYRITPPNAGRARRVSATSAETLRAEGWSVAARTTKYWVELVPPSPNIYNKHRMLLRAAFAWAQRKGHVNVNPIDDIPRRSTKGSRQKVLRREDFYTPEEVEKLLAHAPGIREEAIWLCGAHAGLRLPGEGLGLRWEMIDFDALVFRPHGNWVRNEDDTPKTEVFAAVPMTPRVANVLRKLKDQSRFTSDEDHVFADEQRGHPMSGERLRAAFAQAVQEAGLKPIPMYNLRHSFGTQLAARNVPLRTIQQLMRHSLISTTQMYLAYAPQPDLARILALALEPRASTASDGDQPADLRSRLEEEIPAKWLPVVEQICEEHFGSVAA